MLLVALSKRLETVGWCRVTGNIHTENFQDNLRCGLVIPTSNNHSYVATSEYLYYTATDKLTICNNEEQLPLVIVLERSKRLDSLNKGFRPFGVTRNHHHNKFIMILRIFMSTALKSSDKFESNNL